MINIHEIRINNGDVVKQYNKDLNGCNTLEKLKERLAYWKPLAEDAYALVQTLTEKRFKGFIKGLKMERKGQFSGNDDCMTILLPMPMFKVAQVAQHFNVPFGCALHRMIESGVLRKDQQNV